MKEHPEAVLEIEKRARAIPSDAVLIIGRYANYLKEYDADCARTSTIVKLAHSHGRPCCLIANESTDATKTANIFNITVIDPYCLHKDINNVRDTGRVDMRGTAYFWRCLAQKGRQNLVVGGRSGSVDIAAYLGVEVVEWDVFNGRGRNAGYPAPPAQIPACAANALGSYLG